MDVLAWLWWAIAGSLGLVWALIWFLISGWVSTLLQIALLVAVIYYFKYGWQRAPAEIWRRTRSFLGMFWNWLRARDATQAQHSSTQVVRISTKEFGDINLSTLLSLLVVFGLILAAQL
jgi:hypothetical protein